MEYREHFIDIIGTNVTITGKYFPNCMVPKREGTELVAEAKKMVDAAYALVGDYGKS